jgi:choice-of-anchor A domain-containing protein
LYSDEACSKEVFKSVGVGIKANGEYPSGEFTTTATGTYFWIAEFSGDKNNKAAATKCKDTGESTIVKAAAVCPNSFSGGSGVPSLGGAGNYALLGLENTTIFNSLVTIEGNEGVSKGGSIRATSSVITGNVYEYQSGQLSGSVTVKGSVIVAPATLTANDAEAVKASNEAAALPATQTFGSITSNTTIVGTSGLNVIKINGNISASITLSGTASSVFVVNVTGNYSYWSTANLSLAGGVTANHVLYNFIGASGTVETRPGVTVNGTLLGVHYKFDIAGTFNGEIIGGNRVVEVVSGAMVRCH